MGLSCYARENPIIWEIPTHILYGEKDNFTAYGTIFEFVQRTNSTLSIMKNGEHWFHTDEQMKFLDELDNKIFQINSSLQGSWLSRR